MDPPNENWKPETYLTQSTKFCVEYREHQPKTEGNPPLLWGCRCTIKHDMTIFTSEKSKRRTLLGLKRTTWALIFERAKIAAPAHVAVLLLTILVLINPIALAIGPNAFLVITYLLLFFYPQGTIGEHIENVLINITVCALGLSIDFLTVCCAIWIDDNNTKEYSSNGSKALGACTLVGLCFVGGLGQSTYPRMKIAIRILLFSSTWTLTTGASTIQSSIFTNQFYPAALAATASLLVALFIYPHSAIQGYATSLVRVFELKHAILDQSVGDFFSQEESNNSTRQPSSKLLALRKSLVQENTMLQKEFEDARLELTYGRISLAETKPLLSIIHRVKGWISCGMGLGTREGFENADLYELDTSSLAEEIRMTLINADFRTIQQNVTELVNETTSAIRVIQACIEVATKGGSPNKVKPDRRWDILYQGSSLDPTGSPGLCVMHQSYELSSAIEKFKAGLASALGPQSDSTKSDVQVEIPTQNGVSRNSKRNSYNNFCQSNMYDAAFLMVSVMEIAKEISAALVICQTMITAWHTTERKKLWWPSFNINSWLKKRNSIEHLTEAIYDHDILEKERHDMELLTREESHVAKPEKSERLGYSLLQWLHRPKVIQLRVELSRLISSLKRNIHLRFALKLAGGVSLLSLASWLTAGRPWFERDRGLWAVVTYIYVLETSTGATIRISFYRAIATIAGVLWAIIAWYISGQGNRYAITFFIVLAQIPASYFILFSKKAQSMGLVFGYTQSIVVLVPLMPVLNGQETGSVVRLGLLRGYQILVGIAAAFLVNTMVWPLHARVHLIQTISYTIQQCSATYFILARQMLNHDTETIPENSRKLSKLESNIEGALSASREYLDMMQSEWSLVPKPTQTLSLITKTLQKTGDLLVLLRRCRGVTLPTIRKDAGIGVLNLRKELISNVLLNFWIISQSLRTREKLPQFIPSCRVALEELTEAMNEEMNQYLLESQLSEHDLSGQAGRNSTSQEDVDPTMLTIPPPSIFFTSRKRSPIQSGQTTPRTGYARRKKMIDYTYFFVFAEHTILSELIFQVEKLQLQAKILVGESSFVDGRYTPNNMARDHVMSEVMLDRELGRI